MTRALTPEERERMVALCALIGKEEDNGRVLELIKELNELLEGKAQSKHQ
jgi:hypothetical protein